VERAFLDSLSTPLLAVDRDGRIQFANRAAAQLWRVPAERLQQLDMGRLFGPGDMIATQVRRALDSETTVTINPFSLLLEEGHAPLSLRVQVDPVLESGQPVEQAMVSLLDVTHQMQIESNEAGTRLMHSIGLMVRRLAHEVQNPLSGIKGATQLLARRTEELPELHSFSKVILREIGRLERLVKDLLQYGGDPPLTRSRFNLHELLDTVIWFQGNSSDKVRFERIFDPSMPDMWGDRDRLHQVFLNLIRNAVEASPTGGVVRVTTRILGPWRSRELVPDSSKTYFQIEVADEGPGVRPENLGSLFTPFFTTKKSGNGLGLSLCYQLVRAHAGQLRYQAVSGGGAAFIVDLPLDTVSAD
jgi:two-component system nitrogen regulation sensor histidine kinase GlnL